MPLLGNDRIKQLFVDQVAEVHPDKIQYIHENPVRRGLVDAPTDWKWSSARFYECREPGPLPIDPAWETTREPRSAL